MKDIKKIFFILLFLFSFFRLAAGELNCAVQVISPQLQTSEDKQILKTLQDAIFEFLNTRSWTNEVFKEEEKIECSITITVTDRKTDIYTADIQVQSRRPVHKSSYYSPLMNVREKNVEFRYLEYQPLEYMENTFSSNLTSILAFYAFMIIGTDYDSFSPEGGTSWFVKAQQIVTNAQNSEDKGWRFNVQDNRYWMVENMLNSSYKPLRECFYRYHRTGFDLMAQDVETGRSNALAALELLQKVYDSKPGNYSLKIFFQAKDDEIVNLFSAAPPDQKNRVFALINEIDPAHTTKWNKITEN